MDGKNNKNASGSRSRLTIKRPNVARAKSRKGLMEALREIERRLRFDVKLNLQLTDTLGVIEGEGVAANHQGQA